MASSPQNDEYQEHGGQAEELNIVPVERGSMEDFAMSGENTEQRGTTSEESTGQVCALHDLQGDVLQTHANDNRPQYMLATVESWRSENIYITKGVTAVKDMVSSKGCVCVIGVPGAGKSTALHHAALSLEKAGFLIYIIHDPKKIFTYYDSSKKQVFVVDDVIGIYSLSQDKVDKWTEYNEVIKNLLGKNTKLLVSVRVQLYKNQKVTDKSIIFMNKSLTTDHVDFSNTEYKLGIDDMKGMLTHHMTISKFDRDIIDKMVKQVWGFTEKELTEMTEEDRQRIIPQYTAGEQFADCFPLLCKVFVNTDFVRLSPRSFFINPFPALTKVFYNIKSDTKHQFCALVLCAVFDGKLDDNLFSPLCELNNEIDEKDVKIRNIIMTSCDIEGPRQLSEIKSALYSLIGVYILKVECNYKMSHRVFHDIVTYIFNDPLFVFEYGTREFIRDRVRLNKDERQHDPYVIIYNDNKNIERLAERLFRDLKANKVTGAMFMAENPNISDDRLVSCIGSKLMDRNQTDEKLIDELFRQCMWVIYHKLDTFKDGDIVQYKLIELCVHLGADCNKYIDWGLYPLHISVMTGSIELTQLLLHNGADKRRVDLWDNYSIFHRICSDTKYNQLELMKLLIRHGGDHSVVRFITNDRHEIRQILDDLGRRAYDMYEATCDCGRQDALLELVPGRVIMSWAVECDRERLQLEEVLSDKSIRILTKSKHAMNTIAKKHTGNLQLVELVHDHSLSYRANLLDRNLMLQLAEDNECCISNRT